MMKENDRLKISVIVPIYKVEKYLRQCVDSILTQSHANLEIILVDDGSPDNCPQFCDEYAAADNRIKVVHKANGGLSDARNAGLDIATGDYTGFVDSDDWITPTMYQELLETAVEYNTEITCCGFIRTDGKRTLEYRNYGRRRPVTGMEMFRDILCAPENIIVWNKLYKRSVFDRVRFPYGEICEDVAVFCDTIGVVRTAAYTGKIGYYYRQRPGSIMVAGKAKPHQAVLAKKLKKIEAFIKEKSP